ncbi:hypothetical protein T4D_973 [Trichinella pseudospiralis]|uniref:Uncharacterized protein n=1 Tax=Trichinella pseudospiralis TaxID=6337 RepID=A0A0V1G2U7_TRIPS|nr:hypothetical protein T4D_973 [Trichinella pseudospiralis]
MSVESVFHAAIKTSGIGKEKQEEELEEEKWEGKNQFPSLKTLSKGLFRFSLAFLPVNNSKSKPFPHNPCPTAPTPHYLYIYLSIIATANDQLRTCQLGKQRCCYGPTPDRRTDKGHPVASVNENFFLFPTLLYSDHNTQHTIGCMIHHGQYIEK